MTHARLLLTGLLLTAMSTQAGEPTTTFTPFDTSVPMVATGTGSFTVTASLGGTSGEFLLDTGASLVTITPELFKRLRKSGQVEAAGQVAARDAAGRLETLRLYRVESLTLGEQCQLGPVNVAVLKGGSRNLLGMSALAQAAPFAVSMSPPALALSRCAGDQGLAAN